MVTGSLPDTFRFKTVSYHSLFLVIFSALIFFGTTNQVHAAKWFTVSGAGVLSGTASGDGISNENPSSGSSEFDFETIQHSGEDTSASFGVLVSSNDQDTAGEDLYIKNTDTVLSEISIDDVNSEVNEEYFDGNNINTASDCTALISNGFKTDKAYKLSSASCVGSLLASGTYKFASDHEGLAIVVVSNAADGIVKIKNAFTSGTLVDPDPSRLLIISKFKVEVDPAVGAAGIDPSTSPHVQAAILVTRNNSEPINVLESANLSVVLEGPIMAKGNVNLGRTTDALPGVYVKYNPLYVAELSKKGSNSTSPFAFKGLMKSKVSWKYE